MVTAGQDLINYLLQSPQSTDEETGILKKFKFKVTMTTGKQQNLELEPLFPDSQAGVALRLQLVTDDGGTKNFY